MGLSFNILKAVLLRRGHCGEDTFVQIQEKD